MADKGPLTTSISEVHADRIEVRGLDLCDDLMGKMNFTEYFLLLLTGDRPSPDLVALTDACLVAIAEHGLVPSVVAARMTLAAAPEAFQGAMAAGLLGCGSVILGASEVAGRLLIEVAADADAGGDLDAAAIRALQRLKSSGATVPGFGHPVHRAGDPRAVKLVQIARARGTAGRHVAALEAVERHLAEVWGRALPTNVSAVIPAVLLDAGYPAAALKGVPLLARCAGLIAHLREEGERHLGFRLGAIAEHAVTYEAVSTTPIGAAPAGASTHAP